MRNIKLVLEYDGTRYKGWQRLGGASNSMTIQGKLESILKKMTGEDLQVIGSGRTDAGVHAYGQVANFHTNAKNSCKEFMDTINAYLPDDIAVLDAKEVSERFHSRLNATSKTYCYRIATCDKADVFARKYLWQHVGTLDIPAMEEAASYCIGTHDFLGFSSLKKSKKSTTRTISSIEITKHKKEIQITFCGNGFLYNMVRILTGTLVEVGQGVRTPASILDILESRNRKDAGVTAPAQGLFLVDVSYLVGEDSH